MALVPGCIFTGERCQVNEKELMSIARKNQLNDEIQPEKAVGHEDKLSVSVPLLPESFNFHLLRHPILHPADGRLPKISERADNYWNQVLLELLLFSLCF